MLNQFSRINSIVGLSIQIQSDHSAIFHACKIHISNKQLDFEKKVVNLYSVDDLSDAFPDKGFISVNITGKPVLQKLVEKIDFINPGNFGSILPNAVFEDFYIQNFISGSNSIISVIRSKEAEAWLDKLRIAGFIPIMLSLGPYAVNSITPQLNVYGDSLVFDGHTLNKSINNYWELSTYDANLRSPYPIKIENEPLDEKLLLSYAAAFQAVFENLQESCWAKVEYLEDLRSNINKGKKTQFISVIVLICFFLLLLINQLILSSLEKSNAEIQSKLNQLSTGSSDYLEITNDLQEKAKKVEVLGWDDDIDKAFIIDQIAKDLPAGVSWESIEINPVDLNLSRNLRRIHLIERSILISGYSNKIVPINNWMENIKNKNWVKSAQMESYLIDESNNKGKFLMMIKY